jgi:hypothetical protein
MKRLPGPEASRGGSALVECLVALAVAAAVFLPALAVLRAAVRGDARVAGLAAAESAARPAACGAAANLRLGAAVPDVAVDDGSAIRVETRIADAPVAADGDAPAASSVVGVPPRLVRSRAGQVSASLVAPPPIVIPDLP